MKIILIGLLFKILAVQGDDLTEDPTDILKTILGQPQELENLLQKYGLKLNETVIKYGNQEDKFFEILSKATELGQLKDNLTEEAEQDLLIALDLFLKVVSDQFSALDSAKLFDLVGFKDSYVEAKNPVDWLTADKICSEIGGNLENHQRIVRILQVRNSSLWLSSDGMLTELCILKVKFLSSFNENCEAVEDNDNLANKILTSHSCRLNIKYVCRRKASLYQYNLVKIMNSDKFSDYMIKILTGKE